ncbi:MAG: hypothetical protein HZB62_15650 [Nitrospirae bacterium]|nr:hypothetical protein [Nitrospirota bacterium]
MLTTKTLDQILGVLELTKKYYATGISPSKAYQKSVKEIAHSNSVRYQTIADGCCRRLNLDDINKFIHLLKEWLLGEPRGLKALIAGNIRKSDEYKIDEFFGHPIFASPVNSQSAGKIEGLFNVITLKAPRSTANQLRALAEAEGRSPEDFALGIINKYVDEYYLLYLKKLINSLPLERRQEIISTLSENTANS